MTAPTNPLEQGIQAYQAGDYHQALDYLQQAAQSDPASAQVYSWTSAIYQRLDQKDKAIAALQQAVEVSKTPDEQTQFREALAELMSTNGQSAEGEAVDLSIFDTESLSLEGREEVPAQSAPVPSARITGTYPILTAELRKPPRSNLIQGLKNKSIRTKLTAALLITSGFTVVGLSVTALMIRNSLSQLLKDQARSELAVLTAQYNNHLDQVRSGFQSQARNRTIIQAITDTETASVAAILEQEADSRNLEIVALVDAERDIVATTHQQPLGTTYDPEGLVTDVLNSGQLIQTTEAVSLASLEGSDRVNRFMSTLDLPATADVLIHYTLIPVEAANTEVVGVLIAGEVVKSSLLEQTNATLESGFSAVFAGSTPLFSNVVRDSTRQANPELNPTILGLAESTLANPTEVSTDQVRLSDQGFVAMAQAVTNHEGTPVAVLMRGASEAQLQDLWLSTGLILVVVAVLAIGVGLLLASMIGQWVAVPLGRLESVSREYAAGNLDARAEVESLDEVGMLANVFNGMAASIKLQTEAQQAEQEQLTQQVNAIASAVKAIAAGNLDTRIPRIEQTQGLIQDLADNINQMTRQIQQLVQEQERLTAEQQALAEERKIQADNIAKQVLQLLTEIKGAARGDLTVRAQVGEGELGAVADSFNYLVSSMRHIVNNIQDTAAQVISTTDTSIASTMTLSSQAQEQAQQVDVTLQQIQQVVQSIQQVALTAEKAREVVSLATQTAIAGGDTVDLTVEGINQLRQTIGDTAKMMKRLGEGSQQIGQIVTSISQIAAKTDLLALNATIEAARAGEQGQGFAVVADEVRKLAERAATSTEEIAGIVNTIQTEISRVIQAMDLGTEEVVRGTQLAAAAKSNLQDIIQVSQEISDLVEQIGYATQNQTGMALTISSTVAEARSTSNTTAQQAMTVSTSLDELTRVVEKLKDSVQSFRTQASDDPQAANQLSTSASDQLSRTQVNLAYAVPLDTSLNKDLDDDDRLSEQYTPASVPANERERLAALQSYHILDTPPEPSFEAMVQAAAEVCDVPTALIALVDAHRQWFKASVGMDGSETSRDIAFAAHALEQSGPLIINDATEDRQFAANPLVVGPPFVRSYTGFPLISAEGFTLGALCVIDYKPRKLTDQQLERLAVLAKRVTMQIESRRELGPTSEA